jgi:hypothetical protein
MVLGGEGPAGLVAIADAGQEQFVAPLPSGFGRTSFLGDSLLLNQTPGRVEIWRIESSAVNRVGSAGLEFPGGLVRPLTLSDLSKVALVDPGGSQIIVITIPSCEMVSSRISIPEVEAAMRGYEAAASAMPVDRRARGNVFPATGIDAHDFLYGVVFPAPWNNAAIVKFDLMGQGSIWRSVQLRPGKIPPRWLCFPDAGLRIVFADGAMAQYVA